MWIRYGQGRAQNTRTPFWPNKRSDYLYPPASADLFYPDSAFKPLLPVIQKCLSGKLPNLPIAVL